MGRVLLAPKSYIKTHHSPGLWPHTRVRSDTWILLPMLQGHVVTNYHVLGNILKGLRRGAAQTSGRGGPAIKVARIALLGAVPAPAVFPATSSRPPSCTAGVLWFLTQHVRVAISGPLESH